MRTKETVKLISQAFNIYEVLVSIESYSAATFLDYLEMPEREYIDKWTPAYNRVMKNKAFL